LEFSALTARLAQSVVGLYAGSGQLIRGQSMSTDHPDDSTRRRLSDEEVESYLRHHRDEDGMSREHMRELLKSELGWKITNWARRLHEAKREQRENIAAMKAYMLGTTSRNDFIYVLIGEFIVKFSQIEMWRRVAFTFFATGMPPESSDLILAKLDFQSLVAITSGLYEKRYAKAPDALWKQVRGIFSQCLALNDERVRIAHGSWIVTDTEMHALHLSRQKMQWQVHFPSREDLKAQIAKLDALDAELQKLLSGDYDPPDDDD
jgi:hypothetical protein